MTYVDVNGLRTWHEVRGEGEPVVLLHGAFAEASSLRQGERWADDQLTGGGDQVIRSRRPPWCCRATATR